MIWFPLLKITKFVKAPLCPRFWTTFYNVGLWLSFHYRRSVALQMHQIPFLPSARGAHDALPDPIVGWGTPWPSPSPTLSTPTASRSRCLFSLFLYFCVCLCCFARTQSAIIISSVRAYDVYVSKATAKALVTGVSHSFRFMIQITRG